MGVSKNWAMPVLASGLFGMEVKAPLKEKFPREVGGAVQGNSMCWIWNPPLKLWDL